MLLALALGPLGCLTCFATPATDEKPSHTCCNREGKCGPESQPETSNKECHLLPFDLGKTVKSDLRPALDAAPVAFEAGTPLTSAVLPTLVIDVSHSPPPLTQSSVLRI